MSAEYDLYRRLVIERDWFGAEEGIALIAAAIRAARDEEREACARIAEEWPGAQEQGRGEAGKAWEYGGTSAAGLIAAAIRGQVANGGGVA